MDPVASEQMSESINLNDTGQWSNNDLTSVLIYIHVRTEWIICTNFQFIDVNSFYKI